MPHEFTLCPRADRAWTGSALARAKTAGHAESAKLLMFVRDFPPLALAAIVPSSGLPAGE